MAAQGNKGYHFLDFEPLSFDIYSECQFRVVHLELKQELKLGNGFTEFDPIELAREMQARKRYIKRFEDSLFEESL